MNWLMPCLMAAQLTIWGSLKPYEPSASGWTPGVQLWWDFGDNVQRHLRQTAFREDAVFYLPLPHTEYPFLAFFDDAPNVCSGNPTLLKFMRFDTLHQPIALNHYYDTAVMFCGGDTLYCFDHVAETLPPKLWDWAWSRSWEVFKAQHSKDYFKRDWKCWKIMPSSPIKQWPEGSGGLDKEGNPP